MWHSGRYRGEFCAAPEKVDSSYFFFFLFFHQKTETRGDAMPSRHSPFNLGNFYCLVDDAAQNKLECLSLRKIFLG